ncbi:hypothetical protein BKA56DRAFT_590276 [Ilyonectria sp. MPI-CAGE-AT-0026]|nr:hypothetical protein BKA56DRAFT_590276 [Ilyonectria sp. MPI-CAGE-AT-0026]
MGRIQVFKPPVLRPLLSSARPQSPPCTQYHNDMATLEVIANPTNAAVDIVLVHGWLDGREPWTYSSATSSVFWPKTLLAAEIPGARIIEIRYDTELKKFWSVSAETPLDTLSDDIFWELEIVRSSTETRKRPIILVAHSIGGLVCENALIRATDGTDDRKELASCIRRMAFLGTPHGADAASWGETARKFLILSQNPDVPITENWIRRLAKFVALSERFPAVVEARSRNAETRLEVACFYEGLRTACGNGSTTLADELSASIPRCPPPERLEANHQNLGVFPNKEDPNFRRVCRQLVRWARDLSKPSGNDQQARFVSNATFSGPNNSGFQLGMNTGTLSGFTFGGGTR